MAELKKDSTSPNGVEARVYTPPTDTTKGAGQDGYAQALAEPEVEFLDGGVISSKASLFRAVCVCNGEKFLVAVLLKFIHDCLLFVNPQILG